MRVYFAAPLFSQMQREWNRRVAEAVASGLPDTTVVLPQDFKAAGRFNEPEHYSLLFRQCLDAIEQCDVLLAVLDGADVDSGTAFEMGVAHTLGKVIVGVRTDYRPGAAHGVNIMCAESCRYLVREFAFQEDPQVLAEAIVRRLRKHRAAQRRKA